MTRSRKAFTLVELLVVIAIIGIIAAMILPVIGQMRQRAWAMKCSNNLRQLALATASHETSKQHRLPGAMEVVGGKRANWAVTLFPYIDQRPLYDRWADPTVSQAVVEKPYISLLYCPARPGLDTGVASNSYIANLGFGPRSSDSLPFGPAATLTAPTGGYDYWEAHRKENGPFVDRYSATVNRWNVPKHSLTVTSSDFDDGRSNTILYSENLAAGLWHETGLPTGMVWLYANESGAPVERGWLTNAVITPSAVPAVARINGDKRTVDQVTRAEHARPSSMHWGGVNVAFADGSSRYLNEKIAYHVYQALLTPHGGQSDTPYRSYLLNDGDVE